MFCRHHTDAAVRKLITMIAERDAAILERNSAIAEKVAAREERDTALLQRDMAYADRDSAIEERDAAVAALEIAMTDRNILEKRVATKDSKLFQSFSMTKNCTLLGAIQPSSLSTSRFSSIVAEQSDLCRNGSSKEDQVGLSRKRKIVVKSTLDRTLRTKRSYLSANEERGHEIGDGEETDHYARSKEEIYVENVRYPIPHCSCTGVKQQCYRWGNGGWQSSCCTTMISMYPLPMNPTKRGSRLAGRKMSAGAFEKLLEKLALEGVNVNYPVDLKDHWAKHGTNRYVTLR
ncbi:protein MpBPC2 [Marchantia polymorpha subsp. ruderalis]